MCSYPAALLEWAGHRSGGVRRLFHIESGRPTGQVIETPLIARLRRWVEEVASNDADVPRIVLLIGGPGNGKTEAVEAALCEARSRLDVRDAAWNDFVALFAPTNGAVPRRAELKLGGPGAGASALYVVQDASVDDAAFPGVSAAKLLVDDLRWFSESSSRGFFLACVNRGVLDEAMAVALQVGEPGMVALLTAAISAVSLRPDAPSCWPLDEAPHFAVWPMDVESLLSAEHHQDATSPAEQILLAGTDPARWPPEGACEAGADCPFCTSRQLLNEPGNRKALLRILRYYELAAGKRWSFRDLSSLVSYLLAGANTADVGSGQSPCGWAAKLAEAANSQATSTLRYRAPYLLVAAQYQHALFGGWGKVSIRQFRQDLKDLDLPAEPALQGLLQFFTGSRAASVPATLAPQLASLTDVLDPALADPDGTIQISGQYEPRLRDIDLRFSQSVGSGLALLRRRHCLSRLEVRLLEALALADERLSTPEVRGRRSAAASRVQRLIRDFSCRLVRRSLGTRACVLKDIALVQKFEQVLNGDQAMVLAVAKEVEELLNAGNQFVVHLNTTFGEPLPPRSRQLVLHTARQKVRAVALATAGRPRATIRFLGAGAQKYPIPLTYDLFRSVKELEAGMLSASLPSSVQALIDATRARLAGRVVRDEEAIEDADIRIGLREQAVARSMDQFVIRDVEGA